MTDPVGSAEELDDELDTDDTLVDDPTGEVPASAASIPPRGRKPFELDGRLVPVHSGQALNAAEASAVLGGQSAQVVVAIAEVEAGKTTLFATMYERLTKGEIPGYQFAGSLSLIGFEDRSFDATYLSGNKAEKTARTSRDTDRNLLHITARDAQEMVRPLLLGDVSGEHARTLIEFNDPGDLRPLLRSANRVLLLLDGARLADRRRQNLALDKGRKLLRALGEGGDLRPGTPIDVVVTKGDLLTHVADLDSELERFMVFAARHWPEVRLHRVAARPGGQGVHDLFCSFFAHDPRPSTTPGTSDVATRPFHRFVAHSAIADRLLGQNRWIGGGE